MRWSAFFIVVFVLSIQVGNAPSASPEYQRFHVSARLQPGPIQLGGVIRLTLRVTDARRKSAKGYCGWPDWWQAWRVRSPGAVLDPIAIWTAHPAKGHVWHIQLYVRSGNGKTVLQFGLRRCANHYTPEIDAGGVQRIFWRPHTVNAKLVWTKPISINIQKMPGVTARQAAGPLQVNVFLRKYKTPPNTSVEANLIVKNITNKPTAFLAMSCSWFMQWTTDSNAVACELYGCDRNIIVRHILAPGGSFRWKTKLRFRPSPHQDVFRMGFTSISPMHNTQTNDVVRTYWTEPIHVTIIPKPTADRARRSNGLPLQTPPKIRPK